jgi:BirA family transcriptional regulator, biotin operon repressor / biotin---[acetyl-CoA-carboxylase] ligase
MAGTLAPPSQPPRIVHLETVDSTNAEALRLVSLGERGPLWVLADTQKLGRGRSGRAWTSQPGNLFASYLTVLPGTPTRAFQVSLVTGVAVAEAIRALLPNAPGLDLRLKWPNDILLGRAKAGGILVESTQVPGGDLAVVIGIGLNLLSHPPDGARQTAHLAAFGAVPEPKAVLSELDCQLSRWLAIWSGGEGFADIRKAWLSHSGPRGERLLVNSGAGPFEGTFQGLDQDGALLLTDDAGIQHTYSYGDVTLVG